MKSLHKTIKTILSTLCLVLIIGGFYVQANNDNPFFYDTASSTKDPSLEQQLDIGKTIQTDSLSNKSDGILGQIKEIFGLGAYKTGAPGDRPALAYAQMIVNLVLSLVSFIALIIVIFAFYQILFNKGEEGVTKAKKMLSGVAIAIAVMGLSWIIITFFFEILSTQTGK